MSERGRGDTSYARRRAPGRWRTWACATALLSTAGCGGCGTKSGSETHAQAEAATGADTDAGVETTEAPPPAAPAQPQPAGPDLTGTIVWHELATPDVAASIAFYSEVVGWKTQPVGPAYMNWIADSGPVGGMRALTPDERSRGVGAFWTCTVAVRDADAAAATARQQGGKVYVEPVDVPGGRIAAVGEQLGGVVQLLKPATPPAPHDPFAPGEFYLNLISTSSAASTLGFFGQVFGWSLIGDGGTSGGKVLPFGHNGIPVGAVSEDPKVRTNGWLFFAQVPDLNLALARAKRRGATVTLGPQSVPDGRAVQLRDAQGAFFALHEGRPRAQ